MRVSRLVARAVLAGHPHTPYIRVAELLSLDILKSVLRKPSFQTCSVRFILLVGCRVRMFDSVKIPWQQAMGYAVPAVGCQACGLKTSGIFHKPKLISRYVAPSIAPVLTMDAFISASVGEKMLLKLTPKLPGLDDLVNDSTRRVFEKLDAASEVPHDSL